MVLILGLLAFALLGCSCIEFLMIKYLLIKNEEFKLLVHSYMSQTAVLIIINKQLEDKLKEMGVKITYEN